MPTTIIETVTGPTKLVELPVSRTTIFQRPGSANLPAGLIPLGDPNTVLGMNEDGDALEYKVLSGAGGITITHTPGGILITGGGGGGTVTSVAMTVPSIMSVAGSPITTSGTLAVTLTTQSANTVFAGPTTGAAATPTFRALVANDIPALAYVTSVGLQMPGAHFQVFNSPIIDAGTLTVSWLTQNSNYFLRSPTGGGTPIFGTINPDDFTPDAGNAVNYPAMGFYLGASAADATIWEWYDPSTLGTVTSVAMTVPNILSVAGSPITDAGTLTVTLATQSANTIFAGPTAGGAATPTFRSLVLADLPSGYDDTAVIKLPLTDSRNDIDAPHGITNLRLRTVSGAVASTVAFETQVNIVGSYYETVRILSRGTLQLGRGGQSTGSPPGAEGRLQLFQGTGTSSANVTIAVRAPVSLFDPGVPYTVYLPFTPPAVDGQVMAFTIAGVGSWVTPAAGTVTNVTASTPLASSGGATPNITIQIATGAQDGYLSSGDWTTFNNKQAAISFSAASKLLGRGDSGAGAPEEISLGAGLTMTGTTLSATSAGMSIGGTVTSGTTGSVLFVGAGPVLSQDNANFFWDDTNNRLGIGTITPSTPTHVLLTNGTTNTATDVILTVGHNSSGTAASGFGARIDLQAETSTTNDQTVGSIQWAWSTAAHASRVGQVKVYAAINAGNFEVALFSVASIHFAQLSSGLLTSASGTLTANTIAAGRIPFGTSGTAISTNNGLYWDNVNERLGVGSGIADSASYPLHVSHAIAGGGSHAEAITVQNGTTSAGSNGQAVSLRFALKSSTTAGVDAGAILGYWVDATHATATSALMFRTVIAGASNADTLNLAYQTATQASVSLGVQRANAGLSLVPNGTGPLMAAIPDGAASGGNARGILSVDWQMVRGAAADVASGNYSVISGGENNKAAGAHGSIGGGYSNEITGTYGSIGGGNDNVISGNYGSIGGGILNTASGSYATVPGGYQNTASGQYAVATGNYSVASLYGQSAHASGRFSVDSDAQKSALVWRCQTTDATPEEMFLDGASIRSAIGSNRLWTFKILVAALRDDASEGAGYEFTGVIRNDAGTTTLVGAVTKAAWEDDATWDADVTADNTNDALIITITGANAKNINWVASGWLTEVAV